MHYISDWSCHTEAIQGIHLTWFDSKCKKNLLNLSSNKSLKIVLKFAVAIYILVCNSTGDKKLLQKIRYHNSQCLFFLKVCIQVLRGFIFHFLFRTRDKKADFITPSKIAYLNEGIHT